MLKLIQQVVTSKLTLYFGAILLSMMTGAGLFHRFFPPTREIQIVPDTKIVQVEVPVLTERVVNRVIKDPADQKLITKLMKENSDLKLRVLSVSDTTAKNEVVGGTDKGGHITIPEAESIPPAQDPPIQGVSNPVRHYSFKDYQLTAVYNNTGTSFSYSLDQTFKVVSTVGRDHEGQIVTLTKLYQRTPDGDRALPADTIQVRADEQVSRLFVSPRAHLGVARLNDASVGGVVALQWLKIGSSKAPEDLKLGFASPALFFKGGQQELGVLPISWNVGSIHHIPLITNVWISPFISKTHFGFVVGAQF